jgi:hypothetical protein
MKSTQSTNYTGSYIGINNIQSPLGEIQNKCQLDYLHQQLVKLLRYLTLLMQL